MPSPVITPTIVPVRSPSETPWPERYTSPDEICPQPSPRHVGDEVRQFLPIGSNPLHRQLLHVAWIGERLKQHRQGLHQRHFRAHLGRGSHSDLHL